ncbi:hypothetical protein SCANM63S_07168 [Streptomyces canarius]
MDIRWNGGGKRRPRVKERLIVAADALSTLYFMEAMSARLGWAWEPREVAHGRRPVMEIAGIDRRLIGRQSARRQQIEDALPVLTVKYEERQGYPTGERAAYALAARPPTRHARPRARSCCRRPRRANGGGPRSGTASSTVPARVSHPRGR